jgi:hypothetical protein
MILFETKKYEIFQIYFCSILSEPNEKMNFPQKKIKRKEIGKRKKVINLQRFKVNFKLVLQVEMVKTWFLFIRVLKKKTYFNFTGFSMTLFSTILVYNSQKAHSKLKKYKSYIAKRNATYRI